MATDEAIILQYLERWASCTEPADAVYGIGEFARRRACVPWAGVSLGALIDAQAERLAALGGSHPEMDRALRLAREALYHGYQPEVVWQNCMRFELYWRRLPAEKGVRRVPLEDEIKDPNVPGAVPGNAGDSV